MAELPRCQDPKCRKTMQFLAEENNSYVFVCPPPCGAVRIISKPTTSDAAREAVARQRLAASEQPQRKRAYSFAKR